MSKSPPTLPFWKRLPQGPLLAVVAVTLILISVVAIPAPSEDGQEDPVAAAAEAYRSLVDQIDAQESSSSTAEVVPDSLSGGRAKLERSLFDPKPKPQPKRTPRRAPAKPKPPPLPELSAVLIDGEDRKALLSGQVVTVDQEVGGYRIVAIERSAVVLVRDGHVYRLEIGGQ